MTMKVKVVRMLIYNDKNKDDCDDKSDDVMS